LKWRKNKRAAARDEEDIDSDMGEQEMTVRNTAASFHYIR
jgi:hypothetical protein